MWDSGFLEVERVQVLVLVLVDSRGQDHGAPRQVHAIAVCELREQGGAIERDE